MLGLQSLKVSWQESFALLSPSKLGLLLLISIRTLITLYRSLIFAWIMPTALIIGGLAVFIGISAGWPLVTWSGFLLIGSFIIVLLCRAARPSIDLKHSHYWLRFEIADWALFGGLWLLFATARLIANSADRYVYALLLLIYDAIMRLFFLKGQPWLPGAEQLGTFVIFLSPFVIIWALFMLDAQQTIFQYIKAFGRALVMMIYNYPFFFILYESVRIVLAILYYTSDYFNTSPMAAFIAWVFFYALFFPYYICLLTNFYVKRLHDQFGIYYRS